VTPIKQVRDVGNHIPRLNGESLADLGGSLSQVHSCSIKD